ncbi:polycystic kidney disease protein 1-like 2 [Biomphalaria glabrata]
MHVVYTNMKPYNGTCTVTPSQGIALETIFSLKCIGWKDEEIRATRSQMDTNFGLQYAIYQTTSVGFHLVYFGSEVQASTLLSDCPNSALSCEVVVYIIDIYRSKVNFTLNVQIKPMYNQLTTSTSTTSGSVDDIAFDMMKKMNSSISVKDSLKIAKRAATLTSSLSSLAKSVSEEQLNEATTTTAIPLNKPVVTSFSQTATNLVEIVGGLIENYNVRAPEEIQMMANSMSVLTNDTNLMTPDSMVTASSAVQSLTNKVKNVQSKLPDLNHCIDEITDVIHNIIEYQSNYNLDDIYSNIKMKALKQGLSDVETQNFIESEIQKMDLQVYQQSAQIESINSNITSSWDQLLTVLPKMEDPTGKFNKTKQSYLMTTQQTTIADVTNSTDYIPPLGFTFDGVNLGDKDQSLMVVKAIKTKNIFIQGQNSKLINADIIIGSVDDSDGNKLNLSSPRIIHETKESNCSVTETLTTITPQFIEGDASQMFYHQFEYKQTHLFFCLKLRPFNPLVTYTLYLRMDIEPTDLVYDIKKQLTSKTFQPCEEICFPPKTFSTAGTVYIGLKPNINDTVKSSLNLQKRSDSYNLNDAYLFGVTTSACFSWNDTVKDWQTDKCKLTKEKGNVVCTCGDGKEIISAVSFNFEPNTIHFGTVFSKFDIKAQGIVFGVLITLYVMFTLTGFWAHYMDKKGMFQWGVFPLVDNYCDDTYFYLITVHTGLRRSAGTKSNVYFCLSGQDHDTGVRKLSDGIKEGFPSGSVSHFVMACDKCLGDLQCMKIWHDSSGKGNASTWYLDQIDIVDLQSNKAFYFVCGEWLSPEYSLETTIAATCVDELETLKNLFFTNTKQHLTDDHIWLSVFIRPQNSRFSRVERSMCCLAFVMLAMITSAMFYKINVPDVNRKQDKVDFEIGPLRIGYQQIYYSFLSALITATPMLTIMTIFRKSRTKSDLPVKEEHLDTYKVTENTQSHNKDEKKKEKELFENLKKKQCKCSLPWMVKLEKQLEGMEKILLIKSSSRDLKGTWPQQCRYLAWVLVAMTVVVCSFFVILYSMEWGQDVTKEWLTTFILAFLQSLFVVDPFKVIVISVILALLVKKVKQRSLHELDLSLISEVNKEYGLKESRDISSVIMDLSAPLSQSALKMVTLRRKIYVMIKNTLTEFLIHTIYLLIVSSLCYTNRSSNAYQIYKVINDQLITDHVSGFMKINSSGEYFNWTSQNLTEWLYPDLDGSYKDQKLYTKVNDLYLMGEARLRQVRIRKENCSLLDTQLKSCVPSYRSGVEETDDFCLEWKPKPCSVLENLNTKYRLINAWTYKSPLELWGLPIVGAYSTYGGGGYITNLFNDAKLSQDLIIKLKETSWIDQQTRAVFLEFTVYCPNINHFAVVILLAEFTEIGRIVPFVNVYPFTVHNPSGHLGTYVQLCQVLGIVLTILAFMYVVFMVGKKKWSALKDGWFLLDICAVILALCAVIMFMLRLSYTKSALKKLSESRKYYINFYQIVVWDSTYNLCLAFLVAIGYTRLLKLASYSDKTMKVFSVLSKAVKVFPSFFLFNVLILIGFIGTGCALFGKTSYYFKDIWTTAESLFTGLLGRSSFRDTNVPLSDEWMTIVYFCFFVFIVVVFLTNYFIAILMDLLVTNEKTRQSKESTKIFIVLWDSFLNLFGRTRDPTDRLKDIIQDDITVSEEDTYDPLENIMDEFERKLERLIKELDKEINPYSRKMKNLNLLQ